MSRITEVVVYKGEDVLAIGTVHQVAKKLGVAEKTIRFYLTPAYLRRIANTKRQSQSGCRRVVAV